MSNKDFTTVALSPKGKQEAKMVAAITGESLKGLLERLIKEEMERLAQTGFGTHQGTPIQ